MDNVAEDKPVTAADYLEKSLGDVLGEVLAKCASKRTDDPVTFVANEFERFEGFCSTFASEAEDDQHTHFVRIFWC